MNLQENISRIKQMMVIINEQNDDKWRDAPTSNPPSVTVPYVPNKPNVTPLGKDNTTVVNYGEFPKYMKVKETPTTQLSVIEKNVSDPSLIEILKDIEKISGEEFTQEHFDNEIKLSGGIKKVSQSYEPNALKAFKELQQVCNGLKYDDDSLRTYQRQGQMFLEYVKKYGTIKEAMKLRSIPGFSQHHTGKAFDIKPYDVWYCVAKNAQKFGFIFPYMTEGIRHSEPWHIYYNR